VRGLERASGAAALLVCLMAATGCKSVESTGLVVEVHAGGLQAGIDLDAVVATVGGGAPQTFAVAPEAGEGKVAFPFRFGVVPARNSGETVTVDVVGQWQGTNRVRASARVGFLKGQVRLLSLTLRATCVGTSLACASDQTCQDGVCATNLVDVATLPPVGPLVAADRDGAAPDAAAEPDDGPADTATDGRADEDVPAGIDVSGDAPPSRPADAGRDGPDCTEGQTRDCTCGSGAGRQTCAGGAWGPCGTTCDQAGLFGPCAKGTVLCTGAQWGACSIARAGRDTCEKGNDNDCDGKPNGNQDCRCILGETRSCGAGGWLGKCATGTETCTADGWVCNVKASPDTCVKGNDDNCNGTPNDTCECVAGDPPRRCPTPGTCGQGMQTCSVSGKWSACSIAPRSVDSCDPGNDDNCNGKANDVNPACDCVNGTTESTACNTCGDRRTCSGGRWGACPACDCAPGTTESTPCNACGDKRFCGIDRKLGACPSCDCVPGTTEAAACNACGDKRSCGVDRKLSACPFCECAPNTAEASACNACGDKRVCGADRRWGTCPACACVPGDTEPTACNSCGDKRVCVNRSWGTCPSCCPTTILDQVSAGSLTYASSPWRTIWPPPDDPNNPDGIDRPYSTGAAQGTIFLARDTVIRRFPGYQGSFVVSLVAQVGSDFTFHVDLSAAAESWPALQMGPSGPVFRGLDYGQHNQFSSFGAWNGQGTESSARITLYVKTGSAQVAAIGGNGAIRSGFVSRPGLDPSIFSLVGSNLVMYPFDTHKTAAVVGPIKGCAGLTDSQVQSLYDQGKTY
jgi:hypothetical protein